MYQSDQFEKMFGIRPLNYVEANRVLRNQPSAGISVFQEIVQSLTKGVTLFDSPAKVLAVEATVVVLQNTDTPHIVVSMPIMETLGSLVSKYKPVHSPTSGHGAL